MLIQRRVTLGIGRTVLLWWLMKKPFVRNWALILPLCFCMNSYTILSSICKLVLGKTFSSNSWSLKLCSHFHLSWRYFAGAECINIAECIILAPPELTKAAIRAGLCCSRGAGKVEVVSVLWTSWLWAWDVQRLITWQRRTVAVLGKAEQAFGQNHCNWSL